MKFNQIYKNVVLLALLLGGLLAGLVPLSAVQIANFDTLTNDRFSNDGSFVADQFDLSGVGLNGRWATMISENVYITANHYAPSVGSSMTFYASNDPSGTSVTRQITSNRQQIKGTTDILVGTLDSALPSSFSFYDFATEDISAESGPNQFRNSSYDGVSAYVFGRSSSGFGTSQDMAVGRNVMENFASRTISGASSGDSIEALDDGSPPGGLTYEAMLEVGDSGAPLFAENAQGGLTIVGMNWFIADTNDDEVADLFGASYLGNYDVDIQSFIDANAVPEPSSFSLLLAVGCGLVVLRRGNFVC